MSAHVFEKAGMRYYLVKRKPRKGKAVYHARFLSEELDAGGRRRVILSRTTKRTNEQAAHDEVARWIREGRFASPTDLRSYLLSFWDPDRSEYLKGKAAEGHPVARAYAETNQHWISAYFLPFCERERLTELRDLTKAVLLRWRNELFERRTFAEPTVNEKGERVEPFKISASSVNKVRQAVHVALNHAVDMDLIPANPMASIKRVRESPEERAIFEREELGKLFSVAWQDFRAYAACLLAAETGMRLGEVRGLLVRDVHFDDGYLEVVSNWVDTEGYRPPKWGAVRTLRKGNAPYLTPRLTLALKHVLGKHRWGARPDQYVLFNEESAARPMSKQTINRALRNAITAAGIPGDRTFHSFRHSWITHARGRLPDHLIMRSVGHTSMSTTEGYSHGSEAGRKALREYQSNIIAFPG